MDINYISPKVNVEIVIAEIASPEHVIAEALHRAIVAHAFGIPWTPVDLLGVKHLNGRTGAIP